MKRLIFSMLIIASFLGCLSISRITAVASEPDDVSLASETENGIRPLSYCTEEEKEYVYGLLQRDNYGSQYILNPGYKFIKESITPLYEIDLLNYNETKEVNLIPAYARDAYGNHPSRKYYVKMADKNDVIIGWDSFNYVQEYDYLSSGNLIMYIDPEKSHTFSLEYEDHAKQIQEFFGTDDVIPRENMWLVVINKIGLYFFVDYQGKQGLFQVPRYTHDEFISGENFQPDKFIPIEKLQEFADEYMEYLQELHKNAEEHPGEVLVGGDFTPNLEEESSSEETINSATELKEETEPLPESSSESLEVNSDNSEKEPKTELWGVVCAGVAIVVLIGVILLSVLRRRKRTQNEEI